jgi:hypothetical protein
VADAREVADLAPLQQADLDEETLERLLGDLVREAVIDSIAFKGAPDALAASPEGVADPVAALARVREALGAGSAVGVQIRYRHRGRAWCDTLLRTPEGVRLVRSESPA